MKNEDVDNSSGLLSTSCQQEVLVMEWEEVRKNQVGNNPPAFLVRASGHLVVLFTEAKSWESLWVKENDGFLVDGLNN